MVLFYVIFFYFLFWIFFKGLERALIGLKLIEDPEAKEAEIKQIRDIIFDDVMKYGEIRSTRTCTEDELEKNLSYLFPHMHPTRKKEIIDKYMGRPSPPKNTEHQPPKVQPSAVPKPPEPKHNKPKPKYEPIDAANIRSMQWRKFEMFIAEAFRANGYLAYVTPPVNDGGKDIVVVKDGQKCYVECKHWSEDAIIGRELLQKLVGSAAGTGVTNVIFIATCTYNDNARAYAQNLNKAGIIHIELWGIQDVIKFANMPFIP